MIAERVRVTPFLLEQVIACDIMKKTNEHGRAFVKGYIPPGEEENYLALVSGNMNVQIEAVSESGEVKVIFSGMPEDCRIRYSNRVAMLELSLVTHTYRMDVNPALRTFQIPGITYQQIFDAIAGAYPGGGCILAEGEGAVAEDLIVQYQETDWEFLKRIASHLQTVMVPDFQTGTPKSYVGLPRWTGSVKAGLTSYIASKSLGNYLYKCRNQVQGLIEEDEMCYRIRKLEVLELGEQVVLGDKDYYVAEAESHMDGHRLEHTYLLKTREGLQVPKQYNEKIVGASLDGVVTDIAGAQVKVQLGPDAISGEGRWFPFSTVYSSPNGSGWYCMPEKGDEIRLYCPTVKEKHAYVISAVHLPVSEEAAGDRAALGATATSVAGITAGSPEEGSGTPSGSPSGSYAQRGSIPAGHAYGSGTGGVPGNSMPAGSAAGGKGSAGSAAKKSSECRCNPDEKCIRTETGKMVELGPTHILLTNNQGLSILLKDEEGITISSNKKVTIHSDETVDIISVSGIELIGMKNIMLRQADGSMSLTDSGVKLSGADVRMQ